MPEFNEAKHQDGAFVLESLSNSLHEESLPPPGFAPSTVLTQPSDVQGSPYLSPAHGLPRPILPAHSGRPPSATNTTLDHLPIDNIPTLADDGAWLDADLEAPLTGRKKRKRNKPTLSCKECVERKIKCDRGRPHCLACIWRQTDCVYRINAELIDESIRQPSAFRTLHPPKSKHQQSLVDGGSGTLDQNRRSSPGAKPALFQQQGPTDLLLSHIPHSSPASSSIFGTGSMYPFNNYWTQQGGLAEVLDVLPRKNHADILIKKFFESVDPVYPLINRERFYIDYEGFWALDDAEKGKVDSDFLALVFMILAMGTLFVRFPETLTGAQQYQAAEFYSSACHQSLLLFSYLNRTSVRALQSMVFMTYFLLNSNQASGGWAFSGVLVRQAYAMGLNRDPSLISPMLTLFERLERRRLWHSVVCQDSFMSMFLKLPPASTYSDIDSAAPLRENDDSTYTEGSPESSGEDAFNGPRIHDAGYVSSMVTLALLTQETISTPRALSLPMASTTRQRSQLLGRFRATYRSFPDAFRAWDEAHILELAKNGESRLVRQIMFLTNLYWHCVMLIQAEGLEESNTNLGEGSKAPTPMSKDANVRGTLEAASEALKAFFVIHTVLPEEAHIWWSFSHRAFQEALVVADVLKKWGGPRIGSDSETQLAPLEQPHLITGDPLEGRAQLDLRRMLDILRQRAELDDEMARTRAEVLTNYL